MRESILVNFGPGDSVLYSIRDSGHMPSCEICWNGLTIKEESVAVNNFGDKIVGCCNKCSRGGIVKWVIRYV